MSLRTGDDCETAEVDDNGDWGGTVGGKDAIATFEVLKLEEEIKEEVWSCDAGSAVTMDVGVENVVGL